MFCWNKLPAPIVSIRSYSALGDFQNYSKYQLKYMQNFKENLYQTNLGDFSYTPLQNKMLKRNHAQIQHHIAVAGKPVFGVSDKTSFKPVSLATETIQKIEISLVASLDMILCNKRITKALIRLRGRAGWSAPVLFANPRRQVFSCQGPYSIIHYTFPYPNRYIVYLWLEIIL